MLRLGTAVNKIPDWKRARIALQLARAVQQLHRLNILHLDIKPQNVLLGESEGVFLSDVGVSHLMQQTLGPYMPSAAMTVTGSVHYMYANSHLSFCLDDLKCSFLLVMVAGSLPAACFLSHSHTQSPLHPHPVTLAPPPTQPCTHSPLHPHPLTLAASHPPLHSCTH